MNVILRGKVHQMLEDMISEGYANTKSEAIRLAILTFGEQHNVEETMVKKKLDRINKEIREGKRKTLNSKEALGTYAKYVN
jgi:Arc/MetJ-type ribon-helix-helix transcriptional regulator